MTMESNTPAEFVRYFEGIRQRTARLVPLIPSEDFEWRPTPQAFSFGDLLRHLAGMERWMWAENVSGRPARYPGHDASLAQGVEATRRYFENLHEQSMEIFRSLPPDAFSTRVPTPGGSMTAWKWLRAMIEHEAHHRGQLYLMLRMRGVSTPSLFGMTAEQIHSLSS